MDEGHEPERIEIELTSHEPAAPSGRPRRVSGAVTDGAPVETTDPDDLGGPRLLGTEQGRLVAVGAATAVLALIVGVMVGRLGSGDVASSADTSATSEVTTTTDPDRDDHTLPRAPDVLTPPPPPPPPPPFTGTGAGTRPSSSPTTTVDPQRLVEGTIDINPEAPSDQVEVVVVTRSGVLVRIDVATGSTVSTQVDRQFGSPFVSAGPGWVLVPTDDGRSIVVADDGSRSTLELGGWWPPLATRNGNDFWRADIDLESGSPTHLVGVAIDGSETGAVIELDGHFPQMIDPLGGVVVQASGGFYVITPESTTRLTGGQLIALGHRRALVYECDDRLECGYFVIDRTTGTAEPLDIDPEFESYQFGWAGFWSLVEPLSPNEDAVVVATYGPSGQSLAVVDLSTGSYTELGSIDSEPQAAWSPDGPHLYWLDDGKVMVFDRSRGESVPLSEDLEQVAAMTVRAVVGPADESG